MEKNNTSSSSSICSKIRQALANYPAFRAIHRIKQYTRPSEPNKPATNTITATHSSSSPSSPPKHTAKNTAIQHNPRLPQHVKVNTETEKAIPINLDYSTPKVHQVSSPQNVVNNVPRQQGKIPPTKVEFVGYPTNKGTAQGPLKGSHHHGGGLGVQHSEQQQQGQKSLDINDTFAEFIQRAKNKIRTSASNVGRGQENSAPEEGNGANNASSSNKVESQKDHFSDFIQNSKKRLRTTSNVGKTGSLKRG